MSFLAREKRTFAGFLARSFDLLEAEMPEVYGHMCACLAPRFVILVVDGEQVGLVFSDRRARFGEISRIADVYVSTTTRDVLRVIDAETSLVDAVLDDALFVRGELGDLTAFHDGLLAYVHGAVRAPSFPTLLRGFRRARRRGDDVAA